MSRTTFDDLKLSPQILTALKRIGYEEPTPIQRQTIPLVMEGHDVLGIAQTGTGKTAAFCLPMIHKILGESRRSTPRGTHALILTPTRELAIQIFDNLKSYGKSVDQKYAVIFGGVSQGSQVREMKNGVDILVATPGRLLDLIDQGFISLAHTNLFVLDEADRMLDMGFMRDIKKIVPMLPKQRHNLFFSATMPPEIQNLAQGILNKNPKKVEVTPQATTVKKIAQSVMYVEKSDKTALLIDVLSQQQDRKTLVFVEMKYAANRIAEKLEKAGIPNVVIHGNKTQGARQRALQDFTKNKVQVMIATDIASRGIDIDGITHVINFQLSNVAESYVHRIGRTARAGAEGVAISFVTGDEKSFLVHVEKTTHQQIPVVTDHPFHSESAMSAPVEKVGKAKAKIEKERKKELNEAYRKKAQAKRASGNSSGQTKAKSKKRGARQEGSKDRAGAGSGTNTSKRKRSRSRRRPESELR